MNLKDIIIRRRSIRRYKQTPIQETILRSVVQCGMYYPSRSNMQPLKFMLVDNKEHCKTIFESILWGSKISQYRIFNNYEYAPAAYIIVLIDKGITHSGYEYEIGASIQNMLLCATENGLGSLWIKSINKAKLHGYFKILGNVEIDSIVALGYSAHSSATIKYNNSTKTIIDTNYNLLVPKRDQEDILFYNQYGR